MLCPTCVNVDLVMTDRQGVEIDYCPKCRGVWLDRGELDKIIERAAQELRPAQAVPATASVPSRPVYRDDDDDDRYEYNKRKKKSLLGELFDF